MNMKFVNSLKKADVILKAVMLTVVLLSLLSIISGIKGKNILVIWVCFFSGVAMLVIYRVLIDHFTKKTVIWFQRDTYLKILTLKKEYIFEVNSCIDIKEYSDRYVCTFATQNSHILLIFMRYHKNTADTVFTLNDLKLFCPNV